MEELIWTPYPAHDAPVLFDARGHRRVGSLFYETSRDEQRDPIFTMKDVSKHGLISAYELYMESVDEGDAAMKMVGSLAHWRRMVNTRWFMDGVPTKNFLGLKHWREDMAVRDASRAKAALFDKMADGDLQAAKKVYDSAISGKIAGQTRTKKALKSVQGRRGTQAPADVVDLREAFKTIKD